MGSEKVIRDSLGNFYTKGSFIGKHTGTIGKLGCLSFNGNKIITTGGGGIILPDDEELAEKAGYPTTQAKDDPVSYVNHEIFPLSTSAPADDTHLLNSVCRLSIKKK